MRFNPPPNWPSVPPGWTPPPGWQPDPAWPPPPPGWELWVSEPSSGRKVGLIVGALVAVLVIGIGVTVAVIASQRSPEVAGPSTPSPSGQSDEQRIEAVVEEFEQAWNDKDFDAFAPIVCEDMRNAKEFNEADFLNARNIRTNMDVTVASVEVDGDTATATLEETADAPEEIRFVREDGDWKWCEF